jgi:PAS domain S-box-containing protein
MTKIMRNLAGNRPEKLKKRTERGFFPDSLWNNWENYKALLDYLPQKIFIKDRNSLYVYCNQNYARDLKIKPEEIRGKSDYDFFPKEVAEKYRADDKRIMESSGTEKIEELYVQDGRQLSVFTIKFPLKDEKGGVVGIVGIFLERHKQKYLEEIVMGESEEKYRVIFENIGTAMAMIDENDIIILANTEFGKLIGNCGQEIEGTTRWTEFVAQDDSQRLQEYFRLRKANPPGSPHHYEFRFIDTQGAVRYIFMNIDMIPGIKNRIASFLDITDRKKAEEILGEVRERYRMISELTTDYIYKINVDAAGNMVFDWVSEGFPRLTGMEIDDETMYSCSQWSESVYADDRDLFQGFLKDIVSGESRELEYRSVKAGRMLWWYITGRPIWNKDGNCVIGIIGAAKDITEKKIVELHIKKLHNELELKVAQRTVELLESNKELSKEIQERKEIERCIKASNALLKLFGKVDSGREYLRATVKLIRGFSGCRCVGIRLLHEDGSIPYESYINFSSEFWESENWLSVHRDQCACVRVITGMSIKPDSQAMTQKKSFRCDNLLHFNDELSEKDQVKFRNGCRKAGFRSVAVIPLVYKNRIIGAIHLADELESKVPLGVVEFIEYLTPLIGEGLNKFNLSDKIKENYDIQKMINAIMRLSLKNMSLEELLGHSLDMLIALSWLSFDDSASIFLIDDAHPDTLVLKAQNKFPKQLINRCNTVVFGRCVCGRVAMSRKAQFFSNVDENHEITYPGMPDHGHYCVPILFVNRLLGVLNIYVKPGTHRDPEKEEFLELVASALAGIIQRKQTEKKLNETNELLERVFSSTHFLIAYLDANFDFIRVNEAYANKDGSSPDFYTGRNYFQLYPNEEHRSIFRRVIEEGQAYFAYAQPFLFARQSEITYWDWSLQPVKDSFGVVEGIVLALVDVTQRKNAEEALHKAQKELSDAKRLSDIGILAATVAHELRNPLGVIRTAAYNIKRKSKGPLLAGHIANIEKKISESDQIINNLLFYSRLRMPQYESVYLYPLLEECVAIARKKFKEWDAKINKNYRSLKKYAIELDPLQIREVFNNMLNNAFEALVDKCGRIDVSAGYNKLKGEMSITFTDSGVGIAPEDLQKISEPFFTKKSKGTGLGLTVCYQIVNLHRGRIIVDSRKGEGASFAVILPLQKASHEEKSPHY